MKNIQNINIESLGVGRFQSVRRLATVIFLILCANFLNAQDFETSLSQAAKDLVNPVYAIIETPQADGTVEYVKVLKSEIEKINQLENDYEFVRNEFVEIDDEFTYIESLDNKEKPTQRNVKVYFLKDYQDTTYLKMIKAASTRVEVVPACRETATERVLVKLGYTKSVTTPAKYKITADTILVKPASIKTIQPFSQEEVVLEMVKINSATTRWIKRKSRQATCCLTADPDGCQVWCLVEVPARYEIVSKTVLKTPTYYKEIKTPAEYKIVYDSLLLEPMKFERVFVPPVFETIIKSVVKTPTGGRTIEIPAEYKTVTELLIKDSTKFISFEVPLESEFNNESRTVDIKAKDIIRHYKLKK